MITLKPSSNIEQILGNIKKFALVHSTPELIQQSNYDIDCTVLNLFFQLFYPPI